MTQAAQRSLYLSLVPAFYQVQYWPMVNGGPSQNNFPDMGFTSNGDTGNCKAFYKTSSPPPYVSVSYPTYGGTLYYPRWGNGQATYPSSTTGASIRLTST